MQSAPLHPRETQRLRALRETGLLDSLPDEGMDNAVTLASKLAGVPIALVSLVDENRQWFKAKVGLDATETPRDVAFCAHAILTPDLPFVVPNALEDERFHDNPLVVGAPNVIFYAGIPIRHPSDELPLGTLCVIDHHPREVDDALLDALRHIGAMVESLILTHQTALSLDVALARAEASEADLEIACGEARAAAKAKSAFVATMSHEIRTPLNGLLGIGELLRETSLNPMQAQYVDTLVESAEVLGDVVSDVLDFSRLDSGKVEPEALAFDPLDMVEKAAACVAGKAGANGNRVIVLPAHDLPQTVRGDRARLRQIVLNVVGNAAKFTKDGEITVGVSHDGIALEISVTDTGIGISKDACAKIFEAFTQADQSTSRRFGGSGLGLSICRRLAELMGGTIDVESRLGHGSCFTVSIPVDALGDRLRPLARRRVGLAVADPSWQKATEASLVLLGASIERLGTPTDLSTLRLDSLVTDLGTPAWVQWAVLPSLGGPPPGAVAVLRTPTRTLPRLSIEHSPLLCPVGAEALARVLQPEVADEESAEPHTIVGSVLLADDDPVNSLIAKRALTGAGLDVTVVSDGEAAQTAATRGSFDVILLDLHMPKLDGRSVARTLKASGVCVPVLAFTASTRESVEDASEGLFAGWVSKPIKLNELRRIVKSYIELPQAG